MNYFSVRKVLKLKALSNSYQVLPAKGYGGETVYNLLFLKGGIDLTHYIAGY